MKFIKQTKGKDFTAVPPSRLKQEGWFVGIKYDGNYVQIHKEGNKVAFFTSGGKEFHIPHIANIVRALPIDSIILEAEYMYGCQGILGDRKYSARLTTYRTAFAKGAPIDSWDADKDIFKVFDIITKNKDLEYKERLSLLERIMPTKYLVFTKVFQLPRTLEQCIKISRKLRKVGWEGVFAKHETHVQNGSRSNLGIKIKFRPTTELLCTGVEAADEDSKYAGLIGSLVLFDETNGLTVSVGSGLSDEDRTKSPDDFIGQQIEIEYEQIMDTYIQPTFQRIRGAGEC